MNSLLFLQVLVSVFQSSLSMYSTLTASPNCDLNAAYIVQTGEPGHAKTGLQVSVTVMPQGLAGPV